MSLSFDQMRLHLTSSGLVVAILAPRSDARIAGLQDYKSTRLLSRSPVVPWSRGPVVSSSSSLPPIGHVRTRGEPSAIGQYPDIGQVYARYMEDIRQVYGTAEKQKLGKQKAEIRGPEFQQFTQVPTICQHVDIYCGV